MTETITPGRWRGLQTTSNEHQVFTIVAFDQRGSYMKMLPEGTTYETAVQIKRDTVSVLSKRASAVLLDATYGLDPALHMAGSSGLLMALEKSGYTGESTYRRMEFYDDWNIEKMKRVGVNAVKLLVYYHPDAGELAEEIEGVVRDVRQECHQWDMPLFVEPVSYSLDANVPKSSEAFARTRPAVVRETARRLGRLKPDVLKLEFPMDAAFDDDQSGWIAACEAISEVSEVPWVLLSAGVDFDVFEAQVRAACKGGASGFLAGRAIWKEGVPMSDRERQVFLKGTATDRLKKLIDITGSSARPWTEFYRPMVVSEEWYAGYPA